MEFEENLDQLAAFVDSARSVPMTSSVMVDKDELTRLLDQLRWRVPEDLIVARGILNKRQELLAEAQSNAQQLVDDAAEKQRELVSDHEVMRVARSEADALAVAARGEAERLAEEAADYVDGKLAELENVIASMFDIVRQGRDRLGRTRPRAEVAADDGRLI
jgi:chlorite dismutase